MHVLFFCLFVFFSHISVINSSVHSTCYPVEQCTVIYVNTYSQKHLHVCANGTYAVSYGYNKLSVTYSGMVAAYLLELIARRYNRMVFQVFNGLWTMDYGISTAVGSGHRDSFAGTRRLHLWIPAPQMGYGGSPRVRMSQ